MKYRKKPVVVEAFRYYGDIDSLYDLQTLLGDDAFEVPETWPVDEKVVIKTLEGPVYASPGDYIIQGVHGEVYPCSPDIFEETYEPVVEEG